MGKRLLVSVVDDDESVRESLPDLLREMGFDVRAFASAQAFLASDCVRKTRCLLVDVMMPGMTGPQLVSELETTGQSVPVIFITAGQRDVPGADSLHESCVACLYKPFSDEELFEALVMAVRMHWNA